MNAPLSVSTLNSQIKSLLETTFLQIYVQGEISNLTYHNSGHIYFSIKDENSSISCVMFKGNAKYLKFRLEVGQKIVINGNITVYAPRGNYQILCNKIEPLGKGSLALAFEQLKTKLEKKGYFDSKNKKTLPKYPKKIVLVTSQTGAAIEDMKKIAKNRWKLIELILIPTLVQGEGSALDIAKSIKYADSLKCDIMVIGRGGGSVEDLWSFNEEIVANAIYEAKMPVISAVGHETDYLISDFVADIRASTPSNAMEIALPDINEHRIYLDSFLDEYENKFRIILLNKYKEVENLRNLFTQNSIEAKLEFTQSQINLLKASFKSTMSQNISVFQNIVDLLKSNLILKHPDKKDKDGFVQISKENKIISLKDLNVGDIIELQTPHNVASCTINNIKEQ